MTDHRRTHVFITITSTGNAGYSYEVGVVLLGRGAEAPAVINYKKPVMSYFEKLRIAIFYQNNLVISSSLFVFIKGNCSYPAFQSFIVN
jgi:hypothetical protein